MVPPLPLPPPQSYAGHRQEDRAVSSHDIADPGGGSNARIMKQQSEPTGSPRHHTDNENMIPGDNIDDTVRRIETAEDALKRIDTSAGATAGHVADDEVAAVVPGDDSTVTSSPSLSLSPVKRRKKRHKKRSQRGNNKGNKSSSPDSCAGVVKAVAFDHVRVHEFARTLGHDVVPQDGSWPLGMQYEHFDHYQVSLAEYEQDKHVRLQQRLQQYREKACHDDPVLVALTMSGDSMMAAIETRQWDYKPSLRNPLFLKLHEKERKAMLLPGHGNHNDASKKKKTTTSPDQNQTTTTTTRARAASSGSLESAPPLYHDILLQHVQHDLEHVRVDRTAEGSTGCTCRKLQVYLPPADGGGGKKAAHKRLALSKVKDELKARHALPNTSVKREELERLLHDLVEREPCCTAKSCPCVQAGIECQDEACTCWHTDHQIDKGKHCVKSPNAAQIRQRCGNVHGTTTVDLAYIDAYRRRLILTCQAVGATPFPTAAVPPSARGDDHHSADAAAVPPALVEMTND